MELKKELVEWYNGQLQEKHLFLSSAEELSSGYYFLEVLHNFHPKAVDLERLYLKPKSEYELLQNYKLLSACFLKLGWKKLDPERYTKRREKDYLSLAQLLRKVLSTRTIKDSLLQTNLDTTLEEFGNEEEPQPQPSQMPQGQLRMRIMRLEKGKQELLGKLTRVQQELQREGEGDEQTQLHALRTSLLAIIAQQPPT